MIYSGSIDSKEAYKLMCFAWERLLRLFLRIAIALMLASVLLSAKGIERIFPLCFLLISKCIFAEKKASFKKLHLTVFKLE